MTERNQLPHQSYIKSGDWKCQESPSGAHHWVEKTGRSTVYGTFRCLHCSKEKAPAAVNPQYSSRRHS